MEHEVELIAGSYEQIVFGYKVDIGEKVVKLFELWLSVPSINSCSWLAYKIAHCLLALAINQCVSNSFSEIAQL